MLFVFSTIINCKILVALERNNKELSFKEELPPGLYARHLPMSRPPYPPFALCSPPPFHICFLFLLSRVCLGRTLWHALFLCFLYFTFTFYVWVLKIWTILKIWHVLLFLWNSLIFSRQKWWGTARWWPSPPQSLLMYIDILPCRFNGNYVILLNTKNYGTYLLREK